MRLIFQIPFVRMVKFKLLTQFSVNHFPHPIVSSLILLLSLLLLLLLLFTPLEFFTSVLADGFSLEFEWQQVSTSLQDSSQYSGRPQQCCRLDSLQLLFIFQFYIRFLTIFYWISAQDLGRVKVEFVCILCIYLFVVSFGWRFSLTLIILSLGDKKFHKVCISGIL